MIAGTIGLLDRPVADPLESWTNGGGIPALDVRDTQTDLDGDATAQQGMAAGSVEATTEAVTLADNGVIYTTREPEPRRVATSWVADVTGAGVVVAERVRGGGAYPFPFDLFTARTGEAVAPVVIDLDALGDAIDADDATTFRDTWFVGSRSDGDGTAMLYGSEAAGADPREGALGLGFELAWQGTAARGVVYDSGYVAVYSPWTPAVFLTFVDDLLLDHAEIPEEDGEQTTLDGGRR